MNLGTPAYVFDLDRLADRTRSMLDLKQNYSLCYSMKANPFLTRKMSSLVEHIEVCSPGELAICERLEIPGAQIVYSGVNKEPEDIREAMQYQAGVFTAESVHQFELIETEAEREGKITDVLPRLNSGSQFGMSKEDLFYLLENRRKYPHIRIVGIHYFVGTQRKNLLHQKKELSMLKDLFQEVKQRCGFTLERLEYGPGLAVPLFTTDDFSDDLKPFKELNEVFAEVTEWCTLTVEMGRFFATSCGSYYTKVEDIKSVGNTNFAIVDGGINHVNYLGQMMGMKVPVITLQTDHEQSDIKNWCIAGSLCTTNDILVREWKDRDLRIGDVLVFQNIGAYAVTEGIYLFLSRKMPRIWLKEDGEYRLVRDFKDSSLLNTIGGK